MHEEAPGLAGRARPDRTTRDPGRSRIQLCRSSPPCSATTTGDASGSTRSPRCSSTTRPRRPSASIPLTSRRGTSGRSRPPVPPAWRSGRAWPRPCASTPMAIPSHRTELVWPLLWLGRGRRAAASSARCPTRPSAGRCSARPRSPAIRRRRSRPALGTASPSTRSSTSRPFGRRTPCAGGSSWSPTTCGR